MPSNNPFDFSNIFANFDPQAITKQVQDAFGQAAFPSVDVNKIAESQRKNIELMMQTNQAFMESSQALMQRQAAMLQEAINEATEAAKSLGTSGSAKEASEKQVALLQNAYEKALANSNEISGMLKETQDDLTQKVNARIAESIQELKDAIAKVS